MHQRSTCLVFSGCFLGAVSLARCGSAEQPMQPDTGAQDAGAPSPADSSALGAATSPGAVASSSLPNSARSSTAGGVAAAAGSGGAAARPTTAVSSNAGSPAGSSAAAVSGSAGSFAGGSAAAVSGSGGSPATGAAPPLSSGAGPVSGTASSGSAGSSAAIGPDCGTDPLANEQPLGRGFFQEFRGLFGCTKPADLTLYRQMLPEKFDMPADPQVCFYTVNFSVSGVGPYNEAALLMPIEYAGQAGKYVLTMPLDNSAASSGGRAQGFPKYMAEEVSLTNSGNDWTGVVRNAGQIDLQASYTGACRAGGDFPFPDFINLTPIPFSASQTEAYIAPRTGSALMIPSDLLVEPKFYSLQGAVRIEIGDALPWNGLFDETQTFPAQLVTFKGGIDLGSRALD